MRKTTDLVPLGEDVRTVPSRCRPLTDETFTSYMVRLAWHCDVPLSCVMSRLGMIAEIGKGILPAWGTVLSPEQLRTVAAGTRLTVAEIGATLLGSCSPGVVNLEDVDARVPSTLRRAAAREWVLVSGSRFCPECLRARGGAWKLAWKFPWMFACTEHGLLLRDSCACCAKRNAVGRGDASVCPPYLGKVLQPGLCRNVPTEGNAVLGVAGSPCGAVLWEQSATRISSARVLAAQNILDDLYLRLKEGRDVAAGREFLEEVRALATLILYAGEASHACLEEESCQTAMEVHLRAVEVAKATRASGERLGSRLRLSLASYLSPMLAAAVIPRAIEIAAHTDSADLALALEPIAATLRRTTGTVSRQLIKDFHMSARLESALGQAAAGTGSFGRTSVYRATARVGSGVLRPAHVPQIVDDATYQSFFADLFPGVKPWAGQRFCAAAAVKSLGGTWQDAAMLLDLPQAVASYAKKAVPMLNAAGHNTLFRDALDRWLSRLSESLVDYGERRQRYKSLTDLSPDEWLGVCRAVGIRPGLAGGRSRYAAAWLWAKLTCGDWRLSPALGRASGRSDREIYVRMLNGELARALPALGSLARSILDSAGEEVS